MGRHLAGAFAILAAVVLLGNAQAWARPAQCISDKDCGALDGATCQAGICVESACDGTKCKPGSFCVAKSGRATCVDPCASKPCLNDATCHGKDAKTPVCSCTPQFSGERCEVPRDPCATMACGPGAFCVEDNGSASCIDPCKANPCANGATCAAHSAQTRVCSCPTGWYGDACDLDINDCQPPPCLNGGTCTDMLGSYTCDCPSGWTGTNCQTAVP